MLSVKSYDCVGHGAAVSALCVPCSCLLPELVLQQSVGTSYTSTEDDFIIVSLDFGFQNL